LADILGGLSSYHCPGTIHPDAYAVAYWSREIPLVAVRTRGLNGKVVALNFFPPSSDSTDDLWHSNTDGGKMMINALLFVAKRSQQIKKVEQK